MGRPTATLVAAALIALALGASIARADRAVLVDLPACESPHVDPRLLRELLSIELGHGAGEDPLEVTISAELCDEEADAIVVQIRDRAHDASARDAVLVPDDPDRATRSRVLALAIAERARLALALAIATTARPASSVTDELGSPHDAQRTDDERPGARRASPEEIEAEEPLLGPMSLGVAARGLVAPVSGSWALGLRGDLRGRFDDTWSLRGELATTWSRGGSPEGDVDAVVIDAGAALAARVLHDDAIDLAVAVHADVGALVAIGSGPTGRETTHPWLTLGAELEAAIPVARGIWLAFATRASALIFGTRIVQIGVGMFEVSVPIELSYVALSLDLGVRVAL